MRVCSPFRRQSKSGSNVTTGAIFSLRVFSFHDKDSPAGLCAAGTPGGALYRKTHTKGETARRGFVPQHGTQRLAKSRVSQRRAANGSARPLDFAFFSTK